jgi:hypothetical protein
MASSPPQVFISYQRTDAGFARLVREHLAAHGVKTWMDQFDIPVGAYWPDEIDNGLTGSDVVVGILSPDAVESRNVKNEWDWALQHDKRLVLLQVGVCDVPHRYGSINFIDATQSDRTAALAALLATLGIVELSARHDQAKSPSSQMVSPIRHARRSSQRRFAEEPLLAGRDDAKDRLNVAFDATLAGHGQLILLGGEAGIGKTTLTNWLCWAVEERGAIVADGGCYDLSTPPPYGPWLEILRGWPQGDSAPPMPEALHSGESISRLTSQSALFELIAEFLEESSRWRPLVLILEDVHWADQASLDLLRYLIRPIDRARILLVATYRDDEVTRRHPLFTLLPGLARERNATRLVLPRLDEESLRELVAIRHPMPVTIVQRLADYLQQLTEGNPFFSVEVLAALVENGTLTRDGDEWRMENLDYVRVPELVRQVIEGRLVRLGDDAKRLLGVAAVIGHEVPLDMWVAMSGVDEDVLSGVLERATEARMIMELRPRAGFRFAHALIRETVYDGLSLLRRRALHRAVGEMLTGDTQPDPDAVAHHFQQAGDPRAFDWLVRAGERARRSYAWPTAILRYEAALGLVADDPDRTIERGWLLFLLGAMHRGIDLPTSARFLMEAREAAALSGDRTLEVYSQFLRAIVIGFLGDVKLCVSEMEIAVDALDSLTLGDLQWSGRLYTTAMADTLLNETDALADQLKLNPGRGSLAVWKVMTGDVTGGVAEARDVIAIGDTLDSLPISARHSMGDAHYGVTYVAMRGAVEESVWHWEQAMKLYRSFEHLLMMMHVIGNRWRIVTMPFRIDDADERLLMDQHLGETSRRAVDTLLPQQVWLRHDRYWSDVIEGRWARAAEWLPEAVRLPVGQSPVIWLEQLGTLSHLTGNHARAWSTVQEVFPNGRAQAFGSVHIFALFIQQLAAAMCLDANELEQAEAWLAMNADWLDKSDIILGRSEHELLHARLANARGDPALARQHAEGSLSHASSPRQPLGLLASHRLLGELATERREFVVASNHLAESLSLADACAAPFERALTLLALAVLDMAQRDVDAAHVKLAEVRAICEHLGARPTLKRIEALEQRLAAIAQVS